MRLGAGTLGLVLSLPLLASGARANVGLLPVAVSGVDGAKADELRAALEVELQDVLKRRLVKVAAGRACAGDFGADCAMELAAASKAPLDEVAAIAVTGRPGGAWVVDITVRETSEGRRVFHQQVVQSPNDGPGVVGAALRRGLDPASWSGKIAIQGAPADAEVTIDGLRVTGPATVRVGLHHVVVRTADGVQHPFVADVAFGEVATISFGAQAPPPAPSILPAVVLGSVAVAGTGAAAALGGLWSWQCCWGTVSGTSAGSPWQRTVHEFISSNAREGSTVADRDPVMRDSPGNNTNQDAWRYGYGYGRQSTDVPASTQASQLAQQAAAHVDLAAHQALISIYGATALMAGATAVAAGVGAVLAWPSLPDEAGDSTSAP